MFTGRALYQFHLVKSSAARKLIPRELHLVEAFGYTLGGIFFAEYDSSPAGAFNELVLLAGLVWNPPTSCAWASRVFVDSKAAQDHGIQEVGLPSRLASFAKTSVCLIKDKPHKRLPLDSERNDLSRAMVQISSQQRENEPLHPVCRLTYPSSAGEFQCALNC